MNEPDAAIAARIAHAFAGEAPTRVQRFTTGSHHYVYDVAFAHHAPIVVRVATPANGTFMANAAKMSHALRPRGVPLPQILEEGLDAPFPYLILERFAGDDLGAIIGSLAPQQLEAIAQRVAAAQAIAAQMPSAGRYGYAAEAEKAPHAKWSGVIEAGLARTRARIIAAGLFDISVLEPVAAAIETHRAALDALPATPHLHDTTTKNVIVTRDGAFSGIVDVDDFCFGDPRYPCALTQTALRNVGGPVSYVEAWMRAAGQQRDAIFYLYVALCLADFMSEHGQRFNGNERPSTPEARAHLFRLYEEALAKAL